jgi:hypothetical protein
MIKHPANWVFVKVVPGNIPKERYYFDFRSIDRIVQADVACRAAVEALRCKTHGRFRPGVVITWLGPRSHEVRMDPLPCRDELDREMEMTLSRTVRSLYQKWLEEDAELVKSWVESVLVQSGSPAAESMSCEK